jgi:hypothetical protein
MYDFESLLTGPYYSILDQYFACQVSYSHHQSVAKLWRLRKGTFWKQQVKEGVDLSLSSTGFCFRLYMASALDQFHFVTFWSRE